MSNHAASRQERSNVDNVKSWATLLKVWENCRIYNEPPHKVLDMCDKAEALVKAAWEREGVDRLERVKPSKRRKAFTLNSESRDSELPGEAVPQTSEGQKRLKITIRSSQGILSAVLVVLLPHSSIPQLKRRKE